MAHRPRCPSYPHPRGPYGRAFPQIAFHGRVFYGSLMQAEPKPLALRSVALTLSAFLLCIRPSAETSSLPSLNMKPYQVKKTSETPYIHPHPSTVGELCRS